MLAIVDANYKFLWVDIGGRGSNSDAQIFNHSELKECLLHDSIGLPDPAVLPNDIGDELPYYLVGDDAFALSEFMMKPFSRRSMELEERVFNYCLPRARRVVENAFGILANRWQIILNTMYHEPAVYRKLVETCVILHNYLRTLFPGVHHQQLDREDR